MDSRVTENINATHLFPVVGPRGVYRYRTHLDVSQHLSKSMSKFIAINTKLDIKGRATLGRAVAELLKSNITGRHYRFVVHLIVKILFYGLFSVMYSPSLKYGVCNFVETTLKSSVSVEVAGQEEYFTEQNG